jgi:hypothetical protein
MLIVDVSEVILTSETQLLPECGQPIDGGELLWKRYLHHLQGFVGSNAYNAMKDTFATIYRWHFWGGGILCCKRGTVILQFIARFE